MNEISIDSKCGFNYFRLLDPENAVNIKPYHVQLEKSRGEDMKSVMNSVNQVRADLESLKFEVCNNAEPQNVNNLRKNMLNMEEKISNLKEALKEELLILLRNEVSLTKDIQFMERRIEEWGKPVDVQIFKPVKKSKCTGRKAKEENPVTEFQRFLSHSGGHCGGWEEQDHLLFLRERAKHKRKEKFISAFHSILPDLSYEQIEEHEDWYQKYETLRDAQKEAIQKWKLQKQTLHKKEESKVEKKPPVQKGVHHRINIAERIQEWKNQQILRKLEEEERLKREKQKLKQEEKRKQEMQEMKKLAVMQYKAEKLSKLQENSPKEDKKLQAEEAKAKNKILLKAFRLQDMKFIEKKKIIRLHIESKSSEKLRLSKPALEFILQRDPQRVFQPTLIWNQHCLETQKREKIDQVFDLNSIPRLAIPEWRRELK